jgi:hypothetical protein
VQLWAGSMDGKMYIYDADEVGGLSNPRPVSHESLRSGVRSLAHNGIIAAGSWTQKPTRVISGAEDGKVGIWDVDKETLVASASVHANIVSAICSMGDLVCLMQPTKVSITASAIVRGCSCNASCHSCTWSVRRSSEREVVALEVSRRPVCIIGLAENVHSSVLCCPVACAVASAPPARAPPAEACRRCPLLASCNVLRMHARTRLVSMHSTKQRDAARSWKLEAPPPLVPCSPAGGLSRVAIRLPAGTLAAGVDRRA